jgi:hypothetical protein
MKVARSPAGQGAVAGLLAATAIALWFFLIDAIQSSPFETPLFLARVTLGIDGTGIGAITAYTVIHYAVFVLLGVGVAWVLRQFDEVPISLVGLVIGFLLFDLMFYGSLVVTGEDVVRALGWPEVLVGNVVAGVVMTGSLALMGALRPLSWRALLGRHDTIREGLLAGLIGATAVALWFLLVDAVSGRVLFTPAALGSALFRGAARLEAVELSAFTVLSYSALHVAAFMTIGLVAAGVIAAAEKFSEALVLGAVLLFVTFQVFSIGIFAILATWLVETLSWWNIAVANLIAAGGMGYFLYRRHPELVASLRHRDVEEELAMGDERTPVKR